MISLRKNLTHIVQICFQKGGFKNGQYKLVDCTTYITERQHDEFMRTKYGKFEQLMKTETK